MAKQKPLTEEEKIFILKNKDNMYVSEIADKLKRTSNSIRQFLNFRKLSYKKALIPYRTTLTQAETTVMELVAQGLNNKEICRQLAITNSTVVTHLTNIYAKFSISASTFAPRVQAVLKYLRDTGKLE